MSIVIDLADYRDITPKEDEIRLPEDGFVHKARSLLAGASGPDSLVEAHKWLSLAAMRGSPVARVERLKLSRRMASGQVAAAQVALSEFVNARIACHA
jgi:TPR repeat protein